MRVKLHGLVRALCKKKKKKDFYAYYTHKGTIKMTFVTCILTFPSNLLDLKIIYGMVENGFLL